MNMHMPGQGGRVSNLPVATERGPAADPYELLARTERRLGNVRRDHRRALENVRGAHRLEIESIRRRLSALIVEIRAGGDADTIADEVADLIHVLEGQTKRRRK